MKVQALTADDDWQLGKGQAAYISGSAAVAQNVKTRVREFAADWFANVETGIDWMAYLSTRIDAEEKIKAAVRQTVLNTDGVISLDRLEIISSRRYRTSTIFITYTDVYSETVEQELGVNYDA